MLKKRDLMRIMNIMIVILHKGKEKLKTINIKELIVRKKVKNLKRSIRSM